MKKFKWLLQHTTPFIVSLLIIMLFGAVTSAFGIYKTLISKTIIDAATNIKIDTMLRSLFLFGILIIIEMLIQIIISKLSVKSYSKMYNKIQASFYKKIMLTKWASLNKYHSGDLLTRLTSDAEAITNLLINIIPSLTSNIILLFGSFFMLLYFDSTLAVIALVFSPLPIIVSKLLSNRVKKIYKNLQEKESHYRSFIHESIRNITIVKSFCLENLNINKITNIQNEKLSLTISKNNFTIISNTFFSFSSWFIFFLVYGWGALKLSKGTITFGTITALIQLIGNIKEPFSKIASSIPQINSTLASVERLMEIESLESDYSDLMDISKDCLGIEFQNVTFSYDNKNFILKGINLAINPRETVALIGPSGEGKTTLIRMILSLLYPDTGDVFLTNKSEKFKINASTRNTISYVPQGNTLFSGSIYDNLKLGNLNATDEELQTALKAACATKFINDLPKGIHTIIGESGIGLSEGQSQRIAIARALLKKAPILILDEVTSALDSETEINVLEAIKELDPSPTCIIITHRPTALEICNRILKLDNGYIVEVENGYSNDVAI